MGITPKLVTVTVTTAGTRVQVTSDTSIRPSAVYFEALSSNTGQIYIGDVTVSSTVYMARLTIPSTASAPSWQIVSPSSDHRSGGTGIQLSNLYVDSSVNGEKVQVTYVYNVGA